MRRKVLSPTGVSEAGATLSRDRAQAILVQSLVDIIDCDRRLHLLETSFRSSLEPATWRSLIATDAERTTKVRVALAVWDVASVLDRGSPADGHALRVLERKEALRLDHEAVVRRPELARADRKARREVRRHSRGDLL